MKQRFTIFGFLAIACMILSMIAIGFKHEFAITAALDGITCAVLATGRDE